MRFFLIAGLAVALIGCGDSGGKKPESPEMTEIKLNRIARDLVSGHLKDPKSAEFRNQSGICGEVNSKNGFGAYMGFQRFIAGSKELVVFERDSGIQASEFAKVWHDVCVVGLRDRKG